MKKPFAARGEGSSSTEQSPITQHPDTNTAHAGMGRRKFLQVAGIGSGLAALGAGTRPESSGGALALPLPGQTAFELLGRSEQNDATLTHFGYLTHVANLGDELLFSDPNTRTEATALFTFVASTTLDSRHELGNLISTSAPGEMQVFRNEGAGATFTDASSFGRGVSIASFAVRYHNVLNVQAPNQGIVTAEVELSQTAAAELAQGAGSTRFGRPGLRLRLLATGEGTRTQLSPLQSFSLIGGSAVVLK